MSNLAINDAMRVAVLGVLIATLPFPALSQEQPCSNQTTVFAGVHDLLSATYPDVFSKDRYVRLDIGHPSNSSWTCIHGVEFQVLRFAPGTSFDLVAGPQGKLVPPPENQTFLRGRVWFDEKGRAIQVEIEGDEARSKENDAARAFVDSHPESAEAALNDTLTQNGAKYGPTNKEGFLESIHLDKLQKVLGQIRMKSVDFYDFANPEHVGSFAELFWLVKVEAQQRDGTVTKYALTFEPFEGKLTGVTRIFVQK